MGEDSRVSGRVDGNIVATLANWRFGREVAQDFSSHAERSIPFFEETRELIIEASDYFAFDGAKCFDLGCADGAFLSRLANRHGEKPDLRLIGIDSSDAMVEVARRNTAHDSRIDIQHTNIVGLSIGRANLVIVHYTLHFVPKQHRRDILQGIFDCLEPGGGLLLFEKVNAPTAQFQDMTSTWLSGFKAKSGLTAEEIQNKTNALKGILVPNESEANVEMLRSSGFTDVMTIFKWACFEGYLAIKQG